MPVTSLISLSQSLKEYSLPDDLLDNYFLCKSSKQIVCKIGKKWFKVNMCLADQIFWFNLFFHDEIQCFSQWQCEISDFISFLESFLFLLFLWFLLFLFLKFFIISTKFDKSYGYTYHKNGIAFFMTLVKWPKRSKIWFSKSIFNVENHWNLSKKNCWRISI